MSYNEIHRALMRQGLENDGAIKLSSPQNDTEYPAFHERVGALKELDALGVVEGLRLMPDSMHSSRKYYAAHAILTEYGRSEAERFRK